MPAIAPASPVRSPVKRLAGKLQSVIGLAGIVILAILLSPTTPDGANVFLQLGNLTDILRQISVIGIIALAMTFVILTAGIDLSVGSTLALSTSVMALCLTAWHPAVGMVGHILLSAFAAALVCGAIGLVNGAVISVAGIQPFIVTLATMIGVRGLAKWMTGNANIDIGFGTDDAAVFAAFAREKATVIATFAILACLFWLCLSKTVFGRYVRAIGDNEQAGLYTGLPVRRIKAYVYTLCGLLAGVSGILYTGENHQGNPNAGVGYELDAIAAVVVGGTSLSGGKGSISGTIVGTLILGVLTNMLRLKNVDSNVEMMLKAAIIVIAVALQRTRWRRDT